MMPRGTPQRDLSTELGSQGALAPEKLKAARTHEFTPLVD